MEIGNAWEKGSPTQSILPYQALLGFLKEGKLKLCQEITYYNPARLPTPAQWVTIERIRLKDSTSKVWWMAKTEKPKADNRNVPKPYSASMRRLLERGTYNAGKRPSEHQISKTGFLKEHAGAIPPNLIQAANTRSDSEYQTFCRDNGVEPHPARMPEKLAEFFIRFLTDKDDLVLDPFSGSNTTGLVADRLGRRWISIEALPSYAVTGVANFNVRRAKTLLKRLHLV
jgi:site-specific DNA-methyltransferase (cytosine-N4-specific)